MLPPHQRITRDRGCINRSTAHAQEHNSSPHSCRRHRYRQEHLPCRYEDMCGARNPALIAVPLILMSATQSWSQPNVSPRSPSPNRTTSRMLCTLGSVHTLRNAVIPRSIACMPRKWSAHEFPWDLPCTGFHPVGLLLGSVAGPALSSQAQLGCDRISCLSSLVAGAAGVSRCSKRSYG